MLYQIKNSIDGSPLLYKTLFQLNSNIISEFSASLQKYLKLIRNIKNLTKNLCTGISKKVSFTIVVIPIYSSSSEAGEQSTEKERT